MFRWQENRSSTILVFHLGYKFHWLQTAGIDFTFLIPLGKNFRYVRAVESDRPCSGWSILRGTRCAVVKFWRQDGGTVAELPQENPGSDERLRYPLGMQSPRNSFHILSNPINAEITIYFLPLKAEHTFSLRYIHVNFEYRWIQINIVRNLCI